MKTYCTTGVQPPSPPAGYIAVRTLRPDTVLYAGIRCHDGRPITASRLYQEAVRLGCTIRRARPIPPKTVSTPTQLLADRVAPKSFADVVGHKSEITTLRNWIGAWPAQGRAVLIVGPPGIGKTTCAHLLAKEANFAVAEWNASDARTVGALQSLRLGETRIRRELVIMDEVDGLSERGGCAELASLIGRAAMPVICISNTLPPKLAALQKACLLVKFHRPVKGTIAQWLGSVGKAAGIEVGTKAEIEAACEANGNDIRSLLNAMDFRGKAAGQGQGQTQKDAQLDLFAATTRLLSGRERSWTAQEDYVYVDQGMVPLMVHEAYLSASRDIEEAAAASDQISWGDQIGRRLWSTQDWSLLPHVVASTISAARKRTGPIPFQIFPRVLGQMSKCAKHRRWMADAGRPRRLSGKTERMDEAEWIQRLVALELRDGTKGSIERTIGRLEAMGLTREHVGNMGEILLNPMEIPTKTKTALTREYNKRHGEDVKAKKGSTLLKEEAEADEAEEEVDETDEVEDAIGW